MARRIIAGGVDGDFTVDFQEYDPIAEKAAAVAKVAQTTLELLGVSADSAYVTHHDVARAARLSAEVALKGADPEYIFDLLHADPGAPHD